MAANQGNIAEPDQDSQESAAGIINHRPLLQEVVHAINPMVQLDEDVEELLLHQIDDFIDSSLESACRIAIERRSSTVEVKDIKMSLERTWNITVPGFGNGVEKTAKERSEMTEAHLQKLDHFRKIFKH